MEYHFLYNFKGTTDFKMYFFFFYIALIKTQPNKLQHNAFSLHKTVKIYPNFRGVKMWETTKLST